MECPHVFADNGTALEMALFAKDWERVHVLVGLQADLKAASRARSTDAGDESAWRRHVLKPAAYGWKDVCNLVLLEGDVNASFESMS